jgi:(2R)-3-sulfolactate dehydrogenase (NADP+)
MTVTRPGAEWEALAARVLQRAGARSDVAAAVAAALVAAELDGIPSHGLSRLPFYADQVASGKVDGCAVPAVERPAAGLVRCDARNGLAYPAIAAGLAAGEACLHEQGIVGVAVANSHHCGVLGHWVEGLAARGVVGLAFANTPAAIAPAGGARALFGTDPVAFACPRRDGPPLVIDLSMSVVARGRIMLAASRGEAIPAEWARDAAGRPATDPRVALAGTMAAIGGAKGTMLALMVELLAAALTRSQFGFEASSFFDPAGPPPRVGQFFVLVDPAPLGGSAVLDRIDALCRAMLEEPGVRLPGDRRRASRAALAARGITVPRQLCDELERRCP